MNIQSGTAISCRTSTIYGFFRKWEDSLALSGNHLSFIYRDRQEGSLMLASDAIIIGRPRLFGFDIIIECRGVKVSFRGLQRKEGYLIFHAIRYASLLADIEKALYEWDMPDGKYQYMTEILARSWYQRNSVLEHSIRSVSFPTIAGIAPIELGRKFIHILDSWENSIIERNNSWINAQKQIHRELFQNRFKYALTDEQVNAILYDENRNLVVAGAGTGKTSTIIAKTLWLVEENICREDEILLLAFNKKAAEEMATRLNANGIANIRCSTFHSYGLSVIGKATGEKPRLSNLADDDRVLAKSIDAFLADGLRDDNASNVLLSFLAYYRYPDQTPEYPKTSKQTISFAQSQDIRTFTGIKVRSNTEAAIANWLSLNGICWEYERKYEVATATATHSQYHPDFYLPDYSIYIEHWACDKYGVLPSHWSDLEKEKYEKKKEWATKTHELNNTKLIETYSSPEGISAIIDSLRQQLGEAGVEFRKIGREAISDLLKDHEQLSQVGKLIKGFLALYRENIDSAKEILAFSRSIFPSRNRAFLRLFSLYLEKYESELASEKEIDYSDMIREAAKCYDKTSPDPPLKYLIIDELQDISRGRARFVSEVLRCNPNCKLFAVGDDWQSINRFAGSDITIMTEFERYFGNHRTFFLTKTQRFGSLLLEASSMFVQANPEQIKKVLVGARQDSCPMIEIVDTIRKTEEETEISGSIKNEIAEPKEADELGCIDDSEISANLVKGLLKRISKEKCNATVLILARYKHTLRRYTEYIPCLGENSIEFLTVHGSKGREADYAIIVDVTSGKYGFPTEIEDDPIFDLVLAKSMRFPNAEERRLFYVALTRAKIKTFVVTDYRCKSSFVEELESAEYSGLVTTARELIKAPQCPLCGGDTLSRIDGIHGVFYACSSYPRCKGKALRCPYCGRFAISKMNNTFQCLECKKTIRLCPKCKEGFLKYIPEGISRKSGKAFSAFYVCSASSQEDPESCRYKENADNFIDEKL